jgi:RimJ/RimL family protein N-acetyltransferase
MVSIATERETIHPSLLVESAAPVSVLTLERFGLVLTRVGPDDIEDIRVGRNEDHVRMQHLYREPITPEQQQRWFESVNNAWNYFFVIHAHGKKVGVVYVRDFTEGMATSTCGVFIWDKEHLASRTPLMAILAVLDFFFGELRGGGTESVVLRSNQAAMKMNAFFGFAFEATDDEHLTRIHMDLERYLGERERLLRFAKKVIKSVEAQELKLSGVSSCLNFDVINERLRSQARLTLLP